MLPWYDHYAGGYGYRSPYKGLSCVRANEHIAVTVSLTDRDEAFALVDRLNDISVNAGGDADWYVGDEDEEYVYVE